MTPVRNPDELRPIPGFPNYSVTRDGRVWTHRRRRVRGGWRKMATHKGGYSYCMAQVGGRQKALYAHVAVALTFIGPRPDGMEVCHGDGDPSNNSVENLRWDTRSENVKDSYRHGRRLSGAAKGK